MRGRHLAIIALATALTCAFVWVRLQIVRTSYEINEMSKVERAAREEVGALTLRLNEARSPAKLEKLATGKFGMGPARADQLATLNESGPD